MAQLIRLRKPEGGGEFEMVHVRPHRCGPLPQDGSRDDLLVFPVGIVGYEMPNGIPFQCTALNECELCGRTLTAWFEWSKGAGNDGRS